ncbi:MAG: hypothetical protein ACI976_001268, partial [Aureispira sp.]
DVDWKMASVKNTPVLGGRSIRQVQYSNSKSHPIVVEVLDFGSLVKQRTKKRNLCRLLN